MRNQIKSQINPSSPEDTKAHCQPKASAIHGIARAAKAPPTLEPLSNIATAILLSSAGNHPATALLAPGQLNPSPIPSMNRKAIKVEREWANPVRIFTTDHQITAIARPMRVPIASRKIPPRSHVRAYEI